MISETAKIMPNVRLGENPIVEDFVVLGKSPNRHADDSRTLSIGRGAYLRCGTIIYAGTTIGDNFVTGDYAKIREGNVIGNDVRIGSNTIIERDARIGNRVNIHSGCFIPEYTTIEDSVWMGPCSIITNVLHPPCPIFKRDLSSPRPRCLSGPTIKRGAIIGAGSIIMPGVIIGENALVGAGSLVKDDVPANMVVAGSPVRLIRSIKELDCSPHFYRKGELYTWR